MAAWQHELALNVQTHSGGQQQGKHQKLWQVGLYTFLPEESFHAQAVRVCFHVHYFESCYTEQKGVFPPVQLAHV